MVSGIASLVVPSVIAILAVLFVYLLCKWNYVRGRAEGMRDEALAWCVAFDQIYPPNWQSLPIDRDKNRDEQIEINKAYVEVFKLAKQMIGQELVMNRMSALREEWIKLGLIDPQEAKLP